MKLEKEGIITIRRETKMYKKIGFISLLLFLMFFLGVNDYFAQAQELGASLSDVKGRPGKRVAVNPFQSFCAVLCYKV